jgi:murein DD-endopeptidase MepM/ murein hydrolase activator NlpD
MRKYPNTHLKLAGLLVVICAMLVLFDNALEPSSSAPITIAIPTPEREQGDAENEGPPQQGPNLPPLLRLTVKNGDNLSALFAKERLYAGDLQRILNTENAEALADLRPGQNIAIQKTANGRVEQLRYTINPTTTLVTTLTGSDYQTTIETVRPDIILKTLHGRISKTHPSLYHAGQQAGLSDNLIMAMANLFQWDISFALDLRAGDQFTIVFEALQLNGKLIDDGNILAASFVNFGETHVALRYKNLAGETGYFDQDGESLHKAFLRDPVHFSYVSSSFNLNRKHPILKRTMPHRGIDYAANRGTPVRAAGDGKIMKAARNQASGNFVVIQHGEQYITKYLHLSKFGKGIKASKKVKQGQTIGYVGATGLATGPHLHYEFLVGGVHRNPRTVSLPNAASVAQAELKEFKAGVEPWINLLQSNLQSLERSTPQSDLTLGLTQAHNAEINHRP